MGELENLLTLHRQVQPTEPWELPLCGRVAFGLLQGAREKRFDSLPFRVPLLSFPWKCMSANTSHRIGVCFENGYESEGLARILEFVMQHQNSFVPPRNVGRQGLLQIPTATEKESAAAAIAVNEAIHSFDSPLAQPTVA